METGRLLADAPNDIDASLDALASQAVDMRLVATSDWKPASYETTIAHECMVTGPGTYVKGKRSTLCFRPSKDGWSFDRTDRPEQLPIRVAAENVWTSSRSIVLRSGEESNYMRMTEHIIAHRLGLGLDNVRICTASGDPPLFDVGSMPIADALLEAGIVEDKSRPLHYYTVSEPVTLVGANGSFLNFEPAATGDKKLYFDVAIDFPTAIGKQRIQFELCRESFLHGAHARTNCPLREVVFARTIGKLFADIRNLGYTRNNILIAGRKNYYNEPGLMHDGKSLEAVWHRACLDLIAALSLFRQGRLAGRVTSYKSGHHLDCRFMTLAEKFHIWREVK